MIVKKMASTRNTNRASDVKSDSDARDEPLST